MRFGHPPLRRRPAENVVPMINVVFLLLIFFLMTAEIAPPEPFDVAPPHAEGTPVDVGDRLYAGPEGALAYGTARGPAVFAALADRAGEAPLPLRADAGLEGQALAALLARLAGVGQDRVTLLVVP